ncbi:MAG TPA: rRNA maturation RNase YbeY [Terracidiphilus sp.]|nr:rRNA maturation RNase YbeY [Terracidiphilus sp.]
MILIDPELDLSAAADALNPVSAKPSAGPAAKPGAKPPRLPSTSTLARTLAQFLKRAQSEVRLRGQVTVLLTSDAAMRDLNARFRGKNQPTDVLSFPSEHSVRGTENVAGDVAISVETAQRQSAEQGHTLATEIKVLMLHGLLHLAGHDHETDAGEMQRREHSLRARLGLPLGLIERASRRDAGKLAPDGVRRGTRRTQSGGRKPNSQKPRRGDGNAPASSTRRPKP